MDEKEKLLREIFGETVDDTVTVPKLTINTTPLFPLRQIWPEVLANLERLLAESGESKLAASVNTLMVFDRCRCGADYCSSVYTKPRPSDGWGDPHRNLVFWNPETIDLNTRQRIGDNGEWPTTEFTTIIDVVEEDIAFIEILNDHESRCRLVEALPDVEAAK